MQLSDRTREFYVVIDPEGYYVGIPAETPEYARMISQGIQGAQIYKVTGTLIPQKTDLEDSAES